MSEMQKPLLEHPASEAEKEVLTVTDAQRAHARAVIKQVLEDQSLEELLFFGKSSQPRLSSDPK